MTSLKKQSIDTGVFCKHYLSVGLQFIHTDYTLPQNINIPHCSHNPLSHGTMVCLQKYLASTSIEYLSEMY